MPVLLAKSNASHGRSDCNRCTVEIPTRCSIPGEGHSGLSHIEDLSTPPLNVDFAKPPPWSDADVLAVSEDAVSSIGNLHALGTNRRGEFMGIGGWAPHSSPASDNLARTSKCSDSATGENPLTQLCSPSPSAEQGLQVDPDDTIKSNIISPLPYSQSDVAYVSTGTFDEKSLDAANEENDAVSASSSFGSSSYWCLSAGGATSCEDEEKTSYGMLLQQSSCIEMSHIQWWLLYFLDQYVAHITEWLGSHGANFTKHGESNHGAKGSGVTGLERPRKRGAARSSNQRGGKHTHDDNEAPSEDDDDRRKRRARKHTHDEDEAPSEDEDDRRKRAREGGGKSPGPPETALPRLFACFFHKRNPLKFRKTATDAFYKSCPTGYPSVHRLWSDHSWRVHKARIHCPRCKDLFKKQEDLEEHLYNKEPACKVNNDKVVDGISERHRRACTEKAKQCKTEEERWKAIYAILFPGEEVPDPYTGTCQTSSPLAEEMARFAESFKATELPRLLEQLPSPETSLSRSEIHSIAKSAMEDFVKKYNAKLLQHLQELTNPPVSASSSSAQDRNQDNELSITADAYLHIDPQVNTPELALSSNSTQGSQRSQVEQRATLPAAEPALVASQVQDSTIQPGCEPSTYEDQIGTGVNTASSHATTNNQDFVPDSLDPQDLMLNLQRFQPPQSDFQLQEFIQSLFPPELPPLNNNAYSAWMQFVHPEIIGMDGTHQQGHPFDQSTEYRCFPESEPHVPSKEKAKKPEHHGQHG